MTRQTLLQKWSIGSSTSRFFPVHSDILLMRQEPQDGVDLVVSWEKEKDLKRFAVDLPEGKAAGTFRGGFDHGKESFRVVMTVCPGDGPDAKSYLCGLLFQTKRGREGRAIGIWVAEGEQPPVDCPPA